jgi:hypothetical protein
MMLGLLCTFSSIQIIVKSKSRAGLTVLDRQDLLVSIFEHKQRDKAQSLRYIRL